MNQSLTEDVMRRYTEVAELVEEVIARRGPSLTVALPVGIGKASAIADELVRRALDGDIEELTIFTALSLAPPQLDNILAQRLMTPVKERLYAGATEPLYVRLRREGNLPEHIHVREFFYPPGQLLRNDYAQRTYINVNFTQALDVFERLGVDLIAQMVAPVGPQTFDLGSNPDLTRDLLACAERRQWETTPLLVVQVNRRMPPMGEEAHVGPEHVSLVLDDPRYDHELLGAPSLPPSNTEYVLGLRAASMLKDGGSVQIGIGKIGEAVGWATCLRHEHPEAFEDLLTSLGRAPGEEALVEREGGLGAFDAGLYSSTELLSDGILAMYERGVLKRQVFEDADVEEARASIGHTGDEVTPELIAAFVEHGVLKRRPDVEQLVFMRRHGLLALDIELTAPQQVSAWRRGAEERAIDLKDPDCLQGLIEDGWIGPKMKGGSLIHAGFYIGSPRFYEKLRQFDVLDQERISMTSIMFTNTLFGQERLKRASRRHARFINQALMVTLSGAVVSDGLSDGRVISGVGGQFEFVMMAHHLEDARSILLIPATRTSGGEASSNIVWGYEHATIPRHVRDIVITEYGIADLRGVRDEEIIRRLITIADSRFQPELVERAKSAGKLARDWEVPRHARRNTPEAIAHVVDPARQRGVIPRCPFGSDLTEVELDLIAALELLQDKARRVGARRLPELEVGSLVDMARAPSKFSAHLERMGLDAPSSLKERAFRRALLYALSATQRG